MVRASEGARKLVPAPAQREREREAETAREGEAEREREREKAPVPSIASRIISSASVIKGLGAREVTWLRVEG